MTDIEKEELLACVEEDLMETIGMLEAPSRHVGALEEYQCLVDAANDYYETLKEIL